MRNLDFVASLAQNYRSMSPNTEISPNETMYDQGYFQVGVSAVENIAAACFVSNLTSANRILDLPCGHGRVMRHIACMFPRAELHACDLDKAGVSFCAKTFGATPIYSCEDLTKLDFSVSYDIIWIGSLFTHVSREIATRWMAHLANFLNPQGIIVATFHGRWCEYVYKVYPYIGPDRWAKVMKGYSSHGYGYSDYVREESHSFISGQYGISLAKPHATIQSIEEIPGVRIFMYRERAWADHQDVVAFGRPSFDEKWPGM